eukprot:scaffold215510_cov33-Prasinocladus_malaysianus.AAC.1
MHADASLHIQAKINCNHVQAKCSALANALVSLTLRPALHQSFSVFSDWHSIHYSSYSES